VPTPPALRAPGRNAYVGSIFAPDSLRPTLRWAASTTTSNETIAYQLEISIDVSFAAEFTVATTTTTSYTLTAPLPVRQAPPVGARYYWRSKRALRANRARPTRLSGGSISDAAIETSTATALPTSSSEPQIAMEAVRQLAPGAPTSTSALGARFDATADVTLTGANVNDHLGTSWHSQAMSMETVSPMSSSVFRDGERPEPGHAYVYLAAPAAHSIRSQHHVHG